MTEAAVWGDRESGTHLHLATSHTRLPAPPDCIESRRSCIPLSGLGCCCKMCGLGQSGHRNGCDVRLMRYWGADQLTVETLIQYSNQITPSICNNHWTIFVFRKESSIFSFNSSFRTFCKSEKIVNLRTIISPGQFLVSGASGKGGGRGRCYMLCCQSPYCVILYYSWIRRGKNWATLFCSAELKQVLR